SQSAAAVVRGFASHDPALRIAGVVLNRVGSERHLKLVRDAVSSLGVPVLGALPRDETLQIRSRHLGLVQAAEHGDLPARLQRIAEASERHLDIDRVIEIASPPLIPAQAGIRADLPPPGQCIALAQDAAFSFVYPHIVEGWRRAGAQVIPFSPLADEAPPE